MDHNPLLREARKKASETYDSDKASNFKSRRPENRESSFYDFDNTNNTGDSHT